MGVALKRISAKDLDQIKVRELGLDPSRFQLLSPEALSSAIRRAAGFATPCSPATLIRLVVNALEGLSVDSGAARLAVEEVLELMTGHGDLLEARSDTSSMVLYAAPPSFVMRKSGSALLLGVAGDSQTTLPHELQERIKYQGHARVLEGSVEDRLRDRLLESGANELTQDYWLRAPRSCTPQQYREKFDDLLDSVPVTSSEIETLTILDPAAPVRYYPGRWSTPKRHAGRFVGRREQRYGANLWCYVEVDGQEVRRFVDLPMRDSYNRGCDIAWHLQAAIDSTEGHPQQFRIEPTQGEDVRIKFFSPLPQWAQRRLSAIGVSVKSAHCLFAYEIPATESVEEVQRLVADEWLQEITT